MDTVMHELAGYLISQSAQITALFLVVAIACWFLRRASAHWRYILWLVVLAKCLVPPLGNETEQEVFQKRPVDRDSDRRTSHRRCRASLIHTHGPRCSRGDSAAIAG